MLVYVAQGLGGKSGAARLSGDVLSALVSTGRPVTVVTRSSNPPIPAGGASALPAPRRVAFPGLRPPRPRSLARWALAGAQDVPRRLRLGRLRPEVVLVHSLEEHALYRRQPWAGRGPTALIVHESPRHFASAEARHDRGWAVDAMRGYSRLIFVSERCRDEWLGFEELQTMQSVAIPNCAREVEIDALLRRDRAAVRASLGIPADRFVAVTVGTLQPRKGQDLVVESLDALVARVPSLQVDFVGAGIPPTAWSSGTLDWTDLLKARVASGGHDGRVRFLGPREDALERIYASDVLLLPSRAEAQPLTVLEAMALGTPVAAARVDGVPELIEDGESGELFDAQSADAIVSAIARLAADPERRRRMAARAGERYRREFNADLFRRRYRRAVEEMLPS